jgi:hypothetical protein
VRERETEKRRKKRRKKKERGGGRKEGKAIPARFHGNPQGCEALQIMLTNGGEVVSHVHTPPFNRGRFMVLIYVTDCVDSRAVLQLEGLGQLKNPIVSGIEPATFQFSASTSYTIICPTVNGK